jgi:hypothetical protein
MSSARSNAAARNRRAGDSNPVQSPQQQNMRPGQGQINRPGQQMQQQQQQMQQPQAHAKLSLSDAIGLITLRLGRVETIVQHLQTDLPPNEINGQTSEMGDNMKLVDDSVFANIVNRIDQLENVQKQTISKVNSQIQLQTQLQTQLQKQSAQPKIAATSTMVETSQNASVSLHYETKINELNETVKGLHLEIDDLKNMLLKLQSFTMETNQKLSDLIFSDNSSREQGDLSETTTDGIMSNGIQGFLEMLQSQQSGNLTNFINYDTTCQSESESINISSEGEHVTSPEEIVAEEI